MRWPWVSRARLDLALNNLQRAHDEASRERHECAVRYDQSVQFLQDRNVELCKQNESLLEKYHALKLQGAEIPAPRPVPVHREPDILKQAVLSRTHGKPAIQKLALQQLARDRMDPTLNDEQILQRIEQGTDPDGVPG